MYEIPVPKLPLDRYVDAPLLPPWLGIMLQPRRTIRAIVDEDHMYTKRLAYLWGVLSAEIEIGGTLASGVGFAVTLGGLLGLAGLYVSAGFLRFVGWLFGGKATLADVRTVVAWTAIPSMIAAVLWLGLDLLSLGLEGVTYLYTPPHMLLDTIAAILAPVSWTLYLWEVVIAVLCFAEVNHFSVWRSLAVFGSFLLIPASAWLLFSLTLT